MSLIGSLPASVDGYKYRELKGAQDRKYRPDIEGLRAVAVILVVLYHAGLPWLPGGYVGVDVFFVISGYLITRMLVDELEVNGKISFTKFYARRTRRLLPAAALVSIATLVVAWQWWPVTRVRSVSMDAIYTLLYGVNYRFAAEGTQYMAASAPLSPFQHFWSLAVEEQFYFIWPALLLLSSLMLFRRRVSRFSMACVLSVVVIGSLALSIWQTPNSQTWAFFGLHTRVWELALGALVAVLIPWLLRVPRIIMTLLTWVGLVAVLSSAVILTVHSSYPGYLAVWPVLGTVLIIAGGIAGHSRLGAEGLLSLPPVQFVGTISYSWYLWHWPVLILAPAVLDRKLTAYEIGYAVLLSFVCAVISFYILERPIRQYKFNGAVVGALSVSFTAAALAVVYTLGSSITPVGAAVHTATSSELSQVIVAIKAAESTNQVPKNLNPPLSVASEDGPKSIYENGCNLNLEDKKLKECYFGDLKSKTLIVLYGDSHAAHWLPTFDSAGKAHGWKILLETKSACPSVDVPEILEEFNRMYTECLTWRAAANKRIALLRPDLVVLSFNGSSDGAFGAVPVDQQWITATGQQIKTLREAGSKVLFLEDTPWPKGNVPECLEKNLNSVQSCQRSLSKSTHEESRRAGLSKIAISSGATVVDPSPWMCAASCPVIVGDILVYKDSSHMTEAFSRWLAPVVGSEVAKVLAR